MAAPKSVWGIDIGQCALKAIKLTEVDGQLQAEAFDIIEHSKVLSQSDADREELIRISLEEFVARHDLTGASVAIAVPGQTSFTRFVKMPPVDPKKIPELVRFEAEQQIPFDINEVIWRWQSFDDPDSPDVEVGLFAMKRTDVYSVLDPFTELEVGVDSVQMTPLALYNFMTYDQQVADEGATLLVDIGANGTDLVVADGQRLWTRTIQLGGNNFTETLVKAFKLSFSKAEKLKRTAATSKYARQVFQAMRPVFADLVQEIQRSIGYYTSLHRDARFTRIVGVGNGFRLPGLQKFLEQNLNTPVVRLDSFNALQPSEAISAPQFTENVLGFAVAYGLAVQGLELTRIDTNLLPNEISSERRWKKKRPWFAAAAVLLMVATVGQAWRANADYQFLKPDRAKSDEARSTAQTIKTYGDLRTQINKHTGKVKSTEAQIEQMRQIQQPARFWPLLTQTLSHSVADAAVHQPFQTTAGVADFKARGAAGAAPLAPARNWDPKDRHCLVMLSTESSYLNIPDTPSGRKKLLSPAGIAGASTTAGMYGPGAPSGPGRGVSAAPPNGIRVVMTGRCPRNQKGTTALLNILKQRSKARFAALMGGEVEFIACAIVQVEPPRASAAVGAAGGPPGGGAYGPGGGAYGPGGGAYGPGGGAYGPGGGAYGPGGGAYGPGGGAYGPGGGMYGPGGPAGGGAGPAGGGLARSSAEPSTDDIFGVPIAEHTQFRIGWLLKIKTAQTP